MFFSLLASYSTNSILEPVQELFREFDVLM
jgi:hypothetical protein